MCIIPIGIDVERHPQSKVSFDNPPHFLASGQCRPIAPNLVAHRSLVIALLVAGDSLTAKAHYATVSSAIRTDPGRAIAGLALSWRNYETGAGKMHADLADGGIAASEDDLMDV
jgi:hypothetical protein